MNGLIIARKRAGMTQQKLADAIGKGQSAIAQWETGSRRPNIDDLMKMAELFDCTTDELLGATRGNATASQP